MDNQGFRTDTLIDMQLSISTKISVVPSNCTNSCIDTYSLGEDTESRYYQLQTVNIVN